MSEHARFLAYVLRHAPEAVSLQLGAGGWVGVTDLLKAFRRQGRRLSLEDLKKIVEDDDKQRFTLTPDGLKIRAAQGHSIMVDLGLPNSKPPQFLFHGTARDRLDAIFTEGLQPMRRQHVHLSLNVETAIRVGTRHGKAVVLSVCAAEMFGAGYTFHRADNGVWLTAEVPAKYLFFGERSL